MLIDTAQLTTRRLGRDEALPPARTALIVVDMMRRFCDPRWLAGGDAARERWYAAELDRIIPNLTRLLDGFRQAGALVVHVVNARWTTDGRDVVPYQRGRDYDLFDTAAMSVIDALAPRPGEIVIRKVASSAFTGTGLDFLLRNAGVERLVLSGQYGNACVFYTLIQGRELGFHNYWAEDAILYGSAVHQALFAALVGANWATLASVEDIRRALTRPPVEA
jgi:nicotinamidase-related amidase